jgi:hypothetical protein
MLGTSVLEDGTGTEEALVKYNLVSDAESRYDTQGGENYGSSTMVEQE